MKSITFECETITPMFLAGADGRTPELRPPSLKGLMRFWWRAMNGNLPLEKLKKKEAEIFGASDENIGRSKISIRILSDILQTSTYPPIPYKNFKFDDIIPNQNISIILSTHYNNAIDKYSDILKVSIILGGLGKRARRGFGSVRILDVDSQSYKSEYNLENILKLVNKIGDNKYYKIENGKIVLKQNITAQYPFLKEIEIGKEYDSWKELLKKVAEASHNHDFDSLGFGGNKRLASPIYVSVLKNTNNKYLPIISTLNTVFGDKRTVDDSEQNAFKGAIL